jgi:hypothetical protein
MRRGPLENAFLRVDMNILRASSSFSLVANGRMRGDEEGYSL